MNVSKSLAVPGALVAALTVGVVGGSALNAVVADAATTDSTSTVATTAAASTTDQDTVEPDRSQGGHVGKNGAKEELLTGDTAEKAKAVALAAVSGGTVLRAETDAEGAAYEVHMTKSDGSQVTVKLDSSFKVTSTEEGMR